MTASAILGVSPALTAALSADRQIYNSQLGMLRSRQPDMDFNAIKEFLRLAIDPIVQAVQAADPDRCRFVAQACFQQMLILSEHGLLGSDARSRCIQSTWQQVVPKLTSSLTRDPIAVLASVTNAVDRVATTLGARPESWISGMAAIAPLIDSIEDIRIAGQILAWRAGLAQYRLGALKVSRKLTDRVGSALFASSADDWRASVERHLREPWWRGEHSVNSNSSLGACRTWGVDLQPTTPKSDRLLGVCVGAFAGWDGAFMVPPRLRVAGECFMVASGERYFQLVADAFGSVLIPSNEAHFTEAAAGDTSPDDVGVRGDRLQTRQGNWQIPAPKHDLVVTCNADTVCVSSPWSHHMWLYPR